MKKNDLATVEDLLKDESFRKWVLGQSEQHRHFWEAWLAQNPDKRALVEEATLQLKGIPFEFAKKTVDPDIIQAEWEKLRSRTIAKQESPQQREEQNRLRPRSVRIWSLRTAAVLAVLVVAGFLLQHYVLNPEVVYRTPFGKQLSILLPDSTAIELNANSVLTYRKLNPRKVWLDGEAFFQVKKKPETGAHFWVVTTDLTVEVLGTSFNVLEKNDKTEVVLEEGLIKLNLNRDFEEELFMEPGDLVIFSAKKKETVEKKQVQTKSLTSWKDGVLQFEDVLLTEVMDRIHAIYGWRPVFYDEALRERKISIPLPSDDLETALVILRKAIGVQVEKVEEDKVLLLH